MRIRKRLGVTQMSIMFAMLLSVSVFGQQTTGGLVPNVTVTSPR